MTEKLVPSWQDPYPFDSLTDALDYISQLETELNILEDDHQRALRENEILREQLFDAQYELQELEAEHDPED